jgi:hypothetical protein
VATVTPKMSPKNWTRSPVNIRIATQFIGRLPFAKTKGQ